MIQNKTIVICDRCGEKMVTDYVSGRNIFSSIAHGENHELSEWVEVEKRQLCPACAQDYQELQDRQRREIRDFIGIETLDLEL